MNAAWFTVTEQKFRPEDEGKVITLGGGGLYRVVEVTSQHEVVTRPLRPWERRRHRLSYRARRVRWWLVRRFWRAEIWVEDRLGLDPYR